jgi:AcrR family transcriptional regulator
MAIETFIKLPEDKKKLIIESGLKEFSFKSYQDANTDIITKQIGISKGSLYHYFGSKKGFYIYLLEYSISTVSYNAEENNFVQFDFYQVLFNSLNAKIKLYKDHPLEIRFLNMASKEQSKEVLEEKRKLFMTSMQQAYENTHITLQNAVERLTLKEEQNRSRVLNALNIYSNAIITNYLEKYKNRPDEFFINIDIVKKEVKEYIDLFLYGVMKEDMR